MHSAEELFFLVLLFSVLFSASLPRNRTPSHPKSFRCLRCHAASALPETKNPLPLKSDRGQRVKRLRPVRPYGR